MQQDCYFIIEDSIYKLYNSLSMKLSMYVAIVALLSLGLVLVLMSKFIRLLKSKDLFQEVSEYAIEEYKNKAKTPAMGGVLFVVVPIIVLLVVCPNILSDHKSLMILLSYFLFALIGFLDDFLIIYYKNNNGLSPKLKLLMQLLFAIVIYFLFKDVIDGTVSIPYTDIEVSFGILYLPFMVLLYSAEANAVNFTDGMDGLCAGVSFIALIPFLIFAFLQKENNIVLIIVAILASLLGYLKYNKAPAKIYMGDSGSLALGALFSSLAIVLNQEIALFFVGGVFVVEMLCVCIQLSSVKLFHKRVFSYTPIHYAFRLKGIKDRNIILGFYLAEAIVGVIGLLIGVGL